VNNRSFGHFVTATFALGFSPLCFGQTAIRTRLVDVKTRHPIPLQPITVSLLYGENEKSPAKYDAHFTSPERPRGEAQITLPEPAPAHVAVQVDLKLRHWFCDCRFLVATEDLIEKGIVGPGLALALENPIQPSSRNLGKWSLLLVYTHSSSESLLPS